MSAKGARMNNMPQQSHHNIWVDASAGSGKTYQLVERFTSLLFAGVPADKILCLTYTNAAAIEMRNRIINNLSELTQLDEPDLREKIAPYYGYGTNTHKVTTAQLDHARNLLLHVLDAPEGIAIQTIHAYCQSVLGRFPLEAKLFPGTGIISDYQQKMLMEEALDVLIDQGGLSANLLQPLKIMMGFKDFDGLPKILSQLTSIHYWHQGALPQNLPQVALLAQHIKTMLQLAPDSSIAGLRQALQQTWDTAENLKQFEISAHALHASGKSTDGKYGQIISSYLADNLLAGNLQVDNLHALFLTDKGEPRKSLATKAISADVKDFLALKQQEYLDYYQQVKCHKIAEATIASIELTVGYHQIYQQLKAIAGVVDYDDLILKMYHLLQGAMGAWVLYKCDGGFSHILLDEAQDTNPLQWEIIKNLAENNLFDKGSLFVVGDKKQSIFSFQGANIDNFDDSYQHFTHQTKMLGNQQAVLKNQQLQENRRSCPEIMQLVNHVFTGRAQILGLQTDFPVHKAHRQTASDTGYVELSPMLYYERANREFAYQAYAQLIVQKIKNLLASQIILPSTKTAVKPGDIMVLLPKRDDLAHMLVAYLRKEQIPVTGLNKYLLSDHIVYQDMLLLLEFVNLPANDLNLACLLKSPMVNLSEDELFELSYQRERNSLYQSLQAKASAPDADEKWQKILSWLHQILACADMGTAVDFLLDCYHLDLPLLPQVNLYHAYHARMDVEAIDILEQLLELAQKYSADETASLYGFVEFLYENDAEIKRDFAEINQVKMQTIHGAKGLEAPIVFLCYLGKQKHKPEDAIYRMSSLTQQYTDTDYPIWVPYAEMKTELFLLADEAQKMKQWQEKNRLLYVALTRARDQLYLMGLQAQTAENKDDAQESWYDLVASGIDNNLTDYQHKEFTAVADDNIFLADIASDDDEDEASNQSAQISIRYAGTADGVVAASTQIHDAQQDDAQISPATLPTWARLSPDITEESQAQRYFSPSNYHARKAEALQQSVGAPAMASGSQQVMQYAALRGRLIHKILERVPLSLTVDKLQAQEKLLIKFLVKNGLSTQQAQDDTQQLLQVIAQYPEFFVIDKSRIDARSEVPIMGTILQDNAPVTFRGIIDRLLIGDKQVLILDYKTGKQTAEKTAKYQQVMQIYHDLLLPLYPAHQISAGLLWVDMPSFELLELTKYVGN